MERRRFSVLIFALGLMILAFISGCSTTTSQDNADISNTVIPTFLGNAKVSAIPMPTTTPTVSLPVSMNTPIPLDLSEINLENANRLEKVAEWGMGRIIRAEVVEGSGKFFAFFTTGVIVFDINTFEVVTVIHDDLSLGFTVFNLSPDGEYLAISKVEGGESWVGKRFINVWSTSTGLNVATLTAEDITCGGKLIFSPDNSLLAQAASCDGLQSHSKVAVWELPLPQPILFESWAWDVDFSADGRYLAVAGYENASIKIWEISESNLIPVTPDLAPGANGSELEIMFLAEDNQLVGMYDNYTLLWSIPQGELLQKMQAGGLRMLSRNKYISERNLFLRGGWSSDIILFDTSTGEVRYSSTGVSNFPDISIDGSRLLFRTYEGDLIFCELYELPTRTRVAKWVSGNTLPFFSPDGKYVIDDTVQNTRVFDSSDGKMLYELSGNNAVVLQEEGKIVTINLDQLNVWNLSDGTLLKETSLPSNGIKVQFSPNGKSLFEVFDQGTRKVELDTLTSSIQSFSNLAISQDGKVVVGAIENGIEIREIATGQVINTMYTGRPETWAYLAPDGSIVATEYYDELSLWQVSDGSLLFTIPFNSVYKDLLITTDSLYLITNSRTGAGDEISVWSLQQGELIHSKQINLFNATSECVYSTAISPDQQYVAFSRVSENSEGCAVSVMELTNFEILNTVNVGYGNKYTQKGKMALSNGAEILATSFLKDEVTLWGVSTGKQVLILSDAKPESWAVGLNLPRVHLDFSPDGSFLVLQTNGVVSILGIPID